jgi:hypothetical protein
MPSVRPRMTGLSWLEKSILDLSGNALQPILGTKSAVLKMPKVRLHFLDAVFGCSKLQRKAMCDTQCAAAVLFRGICRLLKQPHYGLSGIIQRVASFGVGAKGTMFSDWLWPRSLIAIHS